MGLLGTGERAPRERKSEWENGARIARPLRPGLQSKPRRNTTSQARERLVASLWLAVSLAAETRTLFQLPCMRPWPIPRHSADSQITARRTREGWGPACMAICAPPHRQIWRLVHRCRNRCLSMSAWLQHRTTITRTWPRAGCARPALLLDSPSGRQRKTIGRLANTLQSRQSRLPRFAYWLAHYVRSDERTEEKLAPILSTKGCGAQGRVRCSGGNECRCRCEQRTPTPTAVRYHRVVVQRPAPLFLLSCPELHSYQTSWKS